MQSIKNVYVPCLISIISINFPSQYVIRLFGDDIDNPGFTVSSIHCSLGTFENFNPLNIKEVGIMHKMKREIDIIYIESSW